jgi:hypothetical protein
MSENGNENGTVNNMENETEVQDAIVKLITKVVEEQWGQFVASGFDVETHIKTAIEKMELGEQTELTGEKVYELLDGYVDWDDVVSNAIDSSVIEDNICWSDAAERICDDIDWDYKIRDNIDIYEIAGEVRDEIDVSDQIQDQIVDWVNNGCSQVDTVAVQLYDRAIAEKGVANDDTVILSRDEYNRIMEVVNFIRPPALITLPKTGRDMADELVAHVSDPQEAMNIVQTAIVAKATADAQALVAAANGESNDGQASE